MGWQLYRSSPIPLPASEATGESYKLWADAVTDELNSLSQTEIDVRDFGAIGDGETDDTVAIRAAIDTAPDGSTILFSDGTFWITKQDDLSGLKIDNRHNLTLRGTGSLITSSGDIASTGYNTILFTRCSNIRVTGMRIDTYLTGAPGARVNSAIVNITSASGSGTTNALVDNNTFKITHASGDDSNRALYGIHFSTQASEGSVYLSSGFKCVDNRFYESDGRHCQAYQADDILIAGNSFVSCAAVAQATVIRPLACTNVRVLGNYVEDAAHGTGLVNAIQLGAGSSGMTCSDYVVADNIVNMSRGTANAQGQGITISGLIDSTIHSNILVQSAQTINKGYGIRVNADANSAISPSNVHITGNHVAGWSTWQTYSYETHLVNYSLTDNYVGLSSDADATQRNFGTPQRFVIRDNYLQSVGGISRGEVPASSTDSGTTGEMATDAGYVYVCTSTDNWSRATLNTF